MPPDAEEPAAAAEERGHTLGRMITGHSRSLLALRGFVEVLAPVLEEQRSRTARARARQLSPLILALQRLSVEDPHLPKVQEDQVRRVFRGDIVIEERDNPDGKSVTLTTRGPDSNTFDQAMAELSKSSEQVDLLYRSSLVSLVSATECFVSQLLHYYFSEHPNAVGGRDNVLSLDDLRRFDSIDDAVKFVVDSRVEQVIRGSIEDWCEFLKAKLHLSLGYLSPHLARMVEVCQRRNLLIHNNGVVNSVYRSRVAPEFAEGTTVGQRISVDPAYLEEAICLFEASFVLVAAEYWKKESPEDKGRGDVLIGLAFSHLSDKRYQVAERLSRFTMEDRRLPEVQQLCGTLNYWQSLKWQGRYEEVREEVDAQDFLAKESRFQLGLHALRDDEEAFFKLLPAALKSGNLTPTDLETWPIFRVIRETERYADFRNEHAAEFVDVSIQSEEEAASGPASLDPQTPQSDIP